MENFKGTKGLKVIESNQVGFAIGNDKDTVITVWGSNDEAKANVKAVLIMREMLEALKECKDWIENCNQYAPIIKRLDDLLTRATTI